jgi:integrase
VPALKPASRGGYTARKWLPPDVRQAYGVKHGDGAPQWEEWFNSGKVSLPKARAAYREWLNLIEARIANIRAERDGTGQTLTPQGARALAGEWYRWFTSNKWPRTDWRAYRDHCWDGVWAALDHPGGRAFADLDKDHVRPIIADEAKTAQFLAAKRLPLDPASRDLFLDYVGQDFFAALDLMVRRAEGDYGEDDYAKRFPKADIADPGLSPWSLFEKWVEKVKPAASTINRWRAVFRQLQSDFPNTSAAALLPEQMQEWAEGLITEDRTAVTVRDVWVIAGRTIFAWAIGAKLVARNPFVGWRVTVPKKISTRETKAFTDDEVATILKAASAIQVRNKFTAAKRWVPWLCAYSGARAGEITQLRGPDVVEQAGIWSMKISPEAGTVKNRKPRTVPLHEHLVEQGFIEFVRASGKGPLFYNEATASGQGEPTNPRRPRAVKARERIAAWVREIGVDDPELQPNHAWRHTFKQIGSRVGILEKTLDAICGHKQASTGRTYGEPTLADKAAALRQFPRFKI